MTAVQKYKVGPHDCLTLDGVDHRCVSSDANGHLFEVVGGGGMTLSFSHARFAAAVLTHGYRFRPNHYAPSRAMSYLSSGVEDLSHLPMHEQVRIRWRLEYALRFVQGEAQKRYRRGDVGFNEAAEAIALELQAQEIDRQIDPSKKCRKRRVGRKRLGGTEGPSGRTLRRDVRKLEKHEWNATVLAHKTGNSGNRTVKVDPRMVGILKLGVKAFLSKRRRSVLACLRIVQRVIREHNRELHDDDCLGYPAWATLESRIMAVPLHVRLASRGMKHAADRASLALSAGLQNAFPGQRLEIDHWSVPLVVILNDIGLTQVLTEKEKRGLEKVTVFACVVFDRASRCVLGLSLSASANTTSAIRALELAVSDKSRIAASVGATFGWRMACTPDSVVSDAGNEFVDQEFKYRVLDLRSSPQTAPAGKPFLRGGNERLFSTLDQGFVSEFRGRTFANPVVRGRYPSKEEASITLSDLLEALTRYIIDVYHNTEQRGLVGGTPAGEWDRLVDRFDLSPPPGRDLRRHVFGEEMSRRTGPHGVTLLGLRYTSLAMHEHFRDRGPCDVTVRVDPLDLGGLSVELPGRKGWMVLDCCTAGFDDVSVSEWDLMARRLQSEHGRDAMLTVDVVDAAMRDIRAMSKRRVQTVGLGADRPTGEQIAALERGLRVGFKMPVRTDVRVAALQDLPGATAPGADGRVARAPDLLNGGVPTGGGRPGAEEGDVVARRPAGVRTDRVKPRPTTADVGEEPDPVPSDPPNQAATPEATSNTRRPVIVETRGPRFDPNRWSNVDDED